VCSAGQLCVGLLSELNQASASDSNTAHVSKTSNDVEMKHNESMSSISSKDGSADVRHFVEV